MHIYLFFTDILILVLYYYLPKIDLTYVDFKSAIKSIYIKYITHTINQYTEIISVMACMGPFAGKSGKVGVGQQ